MDTKLHDCMQYLKKYNQEHLLNFINDLNDIEKENLINEINSIDLEQLHSLYIKSNLDDSISEDIISPIPFIKKTNLTESELNFYSSIGEASIKNNELAIITLAGGQGTRLGYKGPKGSYEIDIPPKKSLFEFACDNLKKAQKIYNININWYIMTSPTNDKATKKYFKDHDYFNYPKESIKFFIQNTLPIIDINAKIILDTPYSIKQASNGNGDVFNSFAKSGLLEDLKNKNIKWIFIGGIDNILLKLIDPLFLGLAINKNYQVASKSLEKTNLYASEWVFANVNGFPSIIDPINIKSENLHLYNQKNMLAHLFSINAFEKLININLPYHRAFKKCDFINEEKMKEVPLKPNSFKFEKFIFDAFNVFDKLLLLEVPENEEFAPIKAFTGNETPETALNLYKKYYNL